MRSVRLLCGALILGGCLAAANRLSAEEPPKPPQTVTSGAPNAADEEFVHELIAVMSETRSSDAFVVAVLALHRAKVDGKLVVPAIIRNAERLKVFADSKVDQEGTTQQKIVIKAIMLMLKTEQAGSHARKNAQRGAVTGAASEVAVSPVVGGAVGCGIVPPSPDCQVPVAGVVPPPPPPPPSPPSMTYQRVHGGIGP